MLGSKLSLFLYHFLTRLSVQTGIPSFSKYPGFLFSFQFPSPLTSSLSSVPLHLVHHGLMRSFLHNILVTPTQHSLDIKAAQLFQPPSLTHTRESRRCFSHHWPKPELTFGGLWPLTAPQPKQDGLE